MSGFLTPQRLDSLGDYKRPPRLSSTVGHLFHLANTLRYSLELPTSLLLASFKSKLPKTSHFSDPLDLHLKHFTDDLRIFVTLGNLFPRWTRLSGSPKVVVDPKKFVLPSPLWGFYSQN
jgi:hypothetical protein